MTDLARIRSKRSLGRQRCGSQNTTGGSLFPPGSTGERATYEMPASRQPHFPARASARQSVAKQHVGALHTAGDCSGNARQWTARIEPRS